MPWVRHYNATFLDILKKRLDQADVTLDVVYGTPDGEHAGRGDTARLPWGMNVEYRTFSLGPYSLTWQPYLEIIKRADLVVAHHASRHLLNYVLIARQAMGGPRVAFWGHGRNFQASSAAQFAAEKVKRWLTRRSHWFFAYNDLSAEVLVESGYPRDRITVVENSIDTRSLRAARERVAHNDLETLSKRLGLKGSNVGIFCGAMYPEKRLPFLIRAAIEIRSRIPDFELVCVGDGVDRYLIDQAADEHDWIHGVGPKFGDALAEYFALASVFLIPGLVGLTVLDSFVFETPLVTTSDAMHSPEIAYLDNGVNGLIVECDGSVATYVDAVVDVLTNEPLRQQLVEGCRRSAGEFSMEKMADNFAEGIFRALSTAREAAE